MSVGEITRYGFRWGPMLVTRLAHVTERGYVLEVRTPHSSMQVYVSEKGRKVRAYPVSYQIRENYESRRAR